MVQCVSIITEVLLERFLLRALLSHIRILLRQFLAKSELDVVWKKLVLALNGQLRTLTSLLFRIHGRPLHCLRLEQVVDTGGALSCSRTFLLEHETVDMLHDRLVTTETVTALVHHCAARLFLIP